MTSGESGVELDQRGEFVIVKVLAGLLSVKFLFYSCVVNATLVDLAHIDLFLHAVCHD
jgi:hypothetical protein